MVIHVTKIGFCSMGKRRYQIAFIVINKEGSRAIALFENTPYYKYIYANPVAQLSEDKGSIIKTYLELIHIQTTLILNI